MAPHCLLSSLNWSRPFCLERKFGSKFPFQTEFLLLSFKQSYIPTKRPSVPPALSSLCLMLTLSPTCDSLSYFSGPAWLLHSYSYLMPPTGSNPPNFPRQSLKQGSENYSSPVFVNKLLLEHSHAHSFPYYDCFCAAVAELGSCNRASMTCRAQNTFYLVLYRKGLLTPELKQQLLCLVSPFEVPFW